MSESTPERLLKAAEAELIAQDGLLEMTAVAKRAGASVGLAYHHFGSKAGLISAVVERFYQPLREVMMGPTGSDPESWSRAERERFKRMVDYYFDHPLAPLLVGRLGREPAVIDMEREHLDALLSEGARNLRAAQANGVLSPEMDADIAIGMIIGGIQQALYRALHQQPRPDRDAFFNKLWTLLGALVRGGDR